MHSVYPYGHAILCKPLHNKNAARFLKHQISSETLSTHVLPQYSPNKLLY